MRRTAWARMPASCGSRSATVNPGAYLRHSRRYLRLNNELPTSLTPRRTLALATRHRPGNVAILRHVPRVDRELRIALAGQPEHRARPDGDGAADGGAEMHPEERQIRIGHRVDQSPHETRSRRGQSEVLAAEGNDLHVDRHPGHLGQPVGLQTPAHHQPVTGHGRRSASRPSLPEQSSAIATTRWPVSTVPPAPRTRSARAVRHQPVVDDAGLRQVQGAETRRRWARVRSARRRPTRRQAMPLTSARSSQRRHAREFGGGGRDDQLSAFVERDFVLGAELLGRPLTRLAESRLEAAGLVVDARVDDSAVVPGLMCGDRRRRLEHDDGGVGLGLEEVVRGRQADDARADDAVAETSAWPNRTRRLVRPATGFFFARMRLA